MNKSPSPNSKPDWYGIACKIRAKYEKLQNRLANLEQSIIGYQKELAKKDALIEQQNQTIIDQQKVFVDSQKKFNQQKDNYDKQKNLSEKLTLELQESQHQRANLERECTLLKDSFSQQEYELKLKDQENKQLQIRLQRQQRSTLEYKSSLEKILEDKNLHSTVISPSSTGIESWGKLSVINTNSPEKESLANDDSFEVKKPLIDSVTLDNLNLVKAPVTPKQKSDNMDSQNQVNLTVENKTNLTDLSQNKIEEEKVKKDIKSSSDKENNEQRKKKKLIQLPNFLK